MTTNLNKLVIRELGLNCDYQQTWDAMRHFTKHRGAQTLDELWLLEHPPVFTQGQAGKAEHILAPGDIPVVQVDRGGQITYHGPGQLIIYTLLDLSRLDLGVRALVSIIENAIIDVLTDVLADVLATYGVEVVSDPKAPGVYINGAKIAQIGMRITRGCSMHGLSFNLNMDTTPFERINPCGYAGQKIAQLADFIDDWNLETNTQVKQQLVKALSLRLGYNKWQHIDGLPSSTDM